MSDASFASVSLLLLGNGTDTSTTIVDSGPLGLTVNLHANVQLSTSSPKFGSAAILFDGTLDYLDASHATALTFSGDFTLDTWIKTADAGRFEIFARNHATRTSANYQLAYNVSAGRLDWYTGDASVLQMSSTIDIKDGTWHHVAITRSGTAVRMYVDGVHKANYTDSPATSLGDSNGIALGATPVNVAVSDMAGRLDCARVTKGVARWTGTGGFTPPTTEGDYLAATGGPFPHFIRRSMKGGLYVPRGF